MQDGELLRQYVEHGSQTAFAQLVERHLALVYSACLREVYDPSLAEDVTQVVFLLLAHKAPTLRGHTALAGWLFQTARFASRNALRQEARRKRAEQKVIQEMATRPETTDVWWESIESLLHRALTTLNPKEREAVLLRFFEGRSVREVGEALGVTEGAAQMRLSRSLDKLRRFFGRRGIALSTAALIGALSARAAHAVPVACQSAILRSVAGTVAGSLPFSTMTVPVGQLTRGVLKTMWTMKVQTALIFTGVSLALLGGGSWVTANGFAEEETPYNAPQSPVSVGDITMVEDPRLAQKVAVTAEGIPLGDLLSLLAKQTGVRLESEETIADEKVILFGPARPLKDLLADLASLYNDIWMHSEVKGTHFYRLMRSVRAREYEDGLGAKRDNALLAQLDAQIKALQESPEQLQQRPPSDPVRRALVDNNGRVATSIFALLSQQQRQQLMDTWRVRLSVSALSPAQKDGIESLFHGALFEEANKDPQIQSGAFPPIAEISRADMDKHTIAFEILNASGVNRESNHMSVTLSAPSGFHMIVTEFSTGARFLFPAHGNPYPGGKSSEGMLPDPATVASATMGPLPDKLRTLAEKTGLSVMADYYRSKPVIVPAGDEPPDPRPAIHALNTLCYPEGYLWWKRGNTLLFRKRDWYNQRLYETPDRWILTLAERLKAQNGIPTYADVLSLRELTTSQIVGMNESLGHPSDRRNEYGLREMLAVIKTIPVDINRSIYTGILSSPTENNLRRASLLPDLKDVRQQRALDAFAQVFDPRFFQDPTLSEFGFLIYSPEAGAPQPGTGNAVNVQIHLYTHNKDGEGMRFGYVVSLPKSLPDDRRSKTHVELAP